VTPRLAIAAALATSVALAGCGGDAESTAPESAKVEIAEFEYAPATVRVAAGGSVTFTNGDRASHTATGDFDTGRLTRGASKRVPFPEAGRFAYVCAFHPYMKGVVEVGGG
jgi:plastocyanin